MVKHAMPQVSPGIPPDQWQLGESGHQSCLELARKLPEWQPSHIITSQETKALQTAHNVGKNLGLPVTTWPDLHEHVRNIGDYTNQADFYATIEQFFATPEQRVFGGETARQSQKRFSAAVHQVLVAYPEKCLVIVTHGTVMTLFVSLTNVIEPFNFWKGLSLPSYIVLALPELSIIGKPVLFN